MAIVLLTEDSSSVTFKSDRWTEFLDVIRIIAVCWLLLVGLWSAPAYGATLVYPNALLSVEGVLAIVLLLSALRGRVLAVRDYPFFWPGLAALTLSALAALLRITTAGTRFSDEILLLWRHGEPMLRGLLLYLAIVGRPKFVRVAWVAALLGLLLQTGAAIEQHFTYVTRWYPDLDRGWLDGWKPVSDPLTRHLVPMPPPRVQGLTSYINLTAAMLAAAIPLFAVPAVFGFTRSRTIRLLLAAGALATAAALWYTDSRGPICAVALVIIIFALLLSSHWRISIPAAIVVFVAATITHSKRVALAVFLAAGGLFIARRWWRSRYLLPVMLALGFAGGMQMIDAYLLHYQLSWRVSDTGLADHSRSVIYHAALETVGRSPFWGIGDVNIAYRVTHLPVKIGLELLPKTQQNFHNQYLQWAASEGIIVALAWTLLVCWSVYWCWLLYRATTDPPARSLALATAAALTIYLLCNLVDAHFWRIEGGGFFWSLLAVTAATGNTSRMDK